MEHQTLGRRFVCPIGPATKREFILDWRISRALLEIHHRTTYIKWLWFKRLLFVKTRTFLKLYVYFDVFFNLEQCCTTIFFFLRLNLKPSINTQFCIKRILVEQNSAFLGHLGSQVSTEKSCYFWGFFSCFYCKNIVVFNLLYNVASILKSWLA